MTWICLALVTILIIIFEIVFRYRLVAFNKKYLRNFSYSTVTERYDAAAPRYFFPEKNYDKAVLFLHGFSTSAQDFEFFCNKLKQKGIPYNAVTLTGYGLTNFRFLRVVRFKDWLREALDAYDQLAMHAEKVHVVGSSFGALLAAVLAKYRQVDKFIAVSPAFFLAKKVHFIIKVINFPVLGTIFKILLPYYVKTKLPNRSNLLDMLDPEMADETFNFAVVPTNVLATFDQAYKMLDLQKIRVNSFYMFSATQDQVVKIDQARQLLKKCGIKYKEFIYTNSAHSVLRDFERDQVADEFLRAIEE